MREIKKEVPVFVQVQSDKLRTVTTYEAEDGKEFVSKRDCIKYDIRFFEGKLKNQLALNGKSYFKGLDEYWYYIKTENDLALVDKLVEYYKLDHRTSVSGDEYGVGSWIMFEYESDDYHENAHYSIRTLDTVKKDFEEFLEGFK